MTFLIISSKIWPEFFLQIEFRCSEVRSARSWRTSGWLPCSEGSSSATAESFPKKERKPNCWVMNEWTVKIFQFSWDILSFYIDWSILKEAKAAVRDRSNFWQIRNLELGLMGWGRGNLENICCWCCCIIPIRWENV